MEDKRLELRLPPAAVVPLMELLLPLAQREDGDALAFTPDLQEVDSDLRDDWRRDLAAHLLSDMGRFVNIFGTDTFMKEGKAEFAPEDCEPLLRATAALRLKLRNERLSALADASLEKGDIDAKRLNRDEQGALAAYMLLAGLQEILIRHLDDSGQD